MSGQIKYYTVSESTYVWKLDLIVDISQCIRRANAGHTWRVFPLLTITATLSFSQLSIVVVLTIKP